MEIRSSGLTDVGLKRDGNEDALSTNDTNGLYIVADGMGGHLGGEVASRIAVEMINNCFERWQTEETPVDEIYGRPDRSLSVVGNHLLGSIRLANRVVFEMASEYDQYHGMGTTVAATHVSPELIVAANAGDSRIYLVRDGGLERLSQDHTIVREQVEQGLMTMEEAEGSPLKHVLTRNLGSSENVEPEVFEIKPAGGDRLILCSDGLTDLVSEQEILDMAVEADEPKELCRSFVNTALKRGGHDNTTVVVVFLSGNRKRKDPILKKTGLIFSNKITGTNKMNKKPKP